MSTVDPAKVADADRTAADVMDKLAAMARQYDEQDLHVAAPALAQRLLGGLSAEVLASDLANVLLRQVRRADEPSVDLDLVAEPARPGVAGEKKQLDPALAGVEVRLIGPEQACRRALALMASAVGLTAFRGPRPADRPGAVRFYASTDKATAAATRPRRRPGTPAG